MSHGVHDAMIVAGGAGTRLWPLTANTPKPLLPFCGPPFLAGVLRRLAEVEVARVWLVVGADPSPFEVLRPLAAELGIELRSVAEPAPLDTAGGVRAAAAELAERFLVLNGDILTDVDLGEVIARHRDVGAAATLVLTRVEDTSSYGVCVRHGERIVGFVEKPAPGELPGQDAVNAGTYVLEPAALTRFEPGPLSFERTVFPELVAAGEHVEGVVSDAVWADLGTRERYLAGHRLALDARLRWPTLDELPANEHGVRVARDAAVAPSAELVGPVLLGPGSRAAAGARLGPHVVLGPGAVLGSEVRVADSVLGAGTELGAGVELAGVVTGAEVELEAEVRALGGALVADHERVPAGTVLGDEARVPERGSGQRREARRAGGAT